MSNPECPAIRYSGDDCGVKGDWQYRYKCITLKLQNFYEYTCVCEFLFSSYLVIIWYYGWVVRLAKQGACLSFWPLICLINMNSMRNKRGRRWDDNFVDIYVLCDILLSPGEKKWKRFVFCEIKMDWSIKYKHLHIVGMCLYSCSNVNEDKKSTMFSTAKSTAYSLCSSILFWKESLFSLLLSFFFCLHAIHHFLETRHGMY